MRSIVIGTAGHIDHGKSTLVNAITGMDPSRLSEEKERGITIDLGFAFRQVADADGSLLQLSFVDVPGHSGFIRNMLAGAAGVDMILLVISAEEGVKPQTKEHLAICAFLGVKLGLAVLTKADAVTPERLALVSNEVSRFLKGSFLESGFGEPVPVSARTGEGIEQLLARIVTLAERSKSRDADGVVRLPVDRSFAMRGFGTVVTGTLLSGAIETGQNLRIEPGGRCVRVRSIQTHGHSVEGAAAGSRVALNLVGIDHNQIARGCTLVEEDSVRAVAEIDVEIELLPNSTPLKHGAHLMFHAGTSECAASVLLYARSRLEAGATGLARVKLRHSVVLAPGDRFILRMPSPAETIGGGIVLDAHPLANQSRQEALSWLTSLQRAGESPESLLMRRVSRRGEQGLARSEAQREMAITSARLDQLARRCILASQITCVAESCFVERLTFAAALHRVETELANHHAGSPDGEGIRRTELRMQTRLPVALFTSVLEELVAAQRITFKADLVSLAGFAARWSADDNRLLATMTDLYRAAGLETPGLPAVTSALRIEKKEVLRLLAVLLNRQALVKVGNDAYVHTAPLYELREKLASLRGQSIGVVGFKQLTGLSRKYAIPWLEYLDRERVTRRVGDLRHVL